MPAEFGLVVSQGIGKIAKRVPELIEDATNPLPGASRLLIHRLLEHLKELDRQADEIGELSTKARDISNRSRRRISANKVSWMRGQTPAFCHASSRRQRTVPEPQHIFCGSRFHGVPERSAYTMPVSTARSGIGLRPRIAGCVNLAPAIMARSVPTVRRLRVL
jgi:hypothetical protein